MSGPDPSERTLHPARAQVRLPPERWIVEEAPDPEAAPMDVIFVGGGPAGLAGAIELARLVRQDLEAGGGVGPIEIGVLEKAAELGGHTLSGAVLNPAPFRELFPDLPEEEFPFRGRVEAEAVYLLRESRALRIPTPPSMRNHGHRIASLCEVVRWMGERAEEMGVSVFPGFPVEALLAEGGRIRGVRTAASGLDREGRPGSGFVPAMELTAKVTVLAEGGRGPLTAAWLEREGIGSVNPQIHALGVKELWRVTRPLRRVIHTLGWPLHNDTFGGSFLYPMGEDLVAIGLVAGLDSPDPALDVHGLLQRLKTHPLVREILKGGDLLEWGAKTIPEGGYHALPARRHGDGLLLVGDAAGYVDVPSLKGVHYAVQSGILAARAIFPGLQSGDTSASGLASYTASIDQSFIARDLRRTRNVRGAFRKGLYRGGLAAAAMTLTGGRFPGGTIQVPEDSAHPRHSPSASESHWLPDGALTFSKLDAVFRSGNRTRDDLPSHLVVGEEVDEALGRFYAHLCPAGVYEWEEGRLIVNAPNCIDCRATDVLGPRWTVREGGSGPAYRRM